MQWNPSWGTIHHGSSDSRAREKCLRQAGRVRGPRPGFLSRTPRHPNPHKDRQVSQDNAREKNLHASFLNNFAFHRQSEGVSSTGPFRSPRVGLRCAQRGFASGRHVRDSRAAPKPTPLLESFSLSLKPQLIPGHCKAAFNSPPTPSQHNPTRRLQAVRLRAARQSGRGVFRGEIQRPPAAA